jgi:hypothetical protein
MRILRIRIANTGPNYVLIEYHIETYSATRPGSAVFLLVLLDRHLEDAVGQHLIIKMTKKKQIFTILPTVTKDTKPQKQKNLLEPKHHRISEEA